MNLNVNDPDRNRPAEEGRNNDPNLRDDSGQQPGVSTMSSGSADDMDAETEDALTNENDLDDDDADLDFEDVDEDVDEDE